MRVMMVKVPETGEFSSWGMRALIVETRLGFLVLKSARSYIISITQHTGPLLSATW